jgi:hypothetical protein
MPCRSLAALYAMHKTPSLGCQRTIFAPFLADVFGMSAGIRTRWPAPGLVATLTLAISLMLEAAVRVLPRIFYTQGPIQGPHVVANDHDSQVSAYLTFLCHNKNFHSTSP